MIRRIAMGSTSWSQALDGEAGLNDIGRAAAAGQVTSALRTRLLVEKWWSDHPELEDERIEAPIFIVGDVPLRDDGAEPPARVRPRQSIIAGVGGIRARSTS